MNLKNNLIWFTLILTLYHINENCQVLDEKSKITEDKVKKAIKAFQNFNLIWDSAFFDKKKDLTRDIIKEVKTASRKIEIVYNF